MRRGVVACGEASPGTGFVHERFRAEWNAPLHGLKTLFPVNCMDDGLRGTQPRVVTASALWDVLSS
jgi:hypothetical protein